MIDNLRRITLSNNDGKSIIEGIMDCQGNFSHDPLVVFDGRPTVTAGTFCRGCI